MTKPIQRTSVSLGTGNSLYWEMYKADLPVEEIRYGDRLITQKLVVDKDTGLARNRRCIQVWHGEEDGGWVENENFNDNFIDTLIANASSNIDIKNGIIVRNMNLDPFFDEKEYTKSISKDAIDE